MAEYNPKETTQKLDQNSIIKINHCNSLLYTENSLEQFIDINSSFPKLNSTNS